MSLPRESSLGVELSPRVGLGGSNRSSSSSRSARYAGKGSQRKHSRSGSRSDSEYATHTSSSHLSQAISICPSALSDDLRSRMSQAFDVGLDPYAFASGFALETVVEVDGGSLSSSRVNHDQIPSQPDIVITGPASVSENTLSGETAIRDGKGMMFDLCKDGDMQIWSQAPEEKERMELQIQVAKFRRRWEDDDVWLRYRPDENFCLATPASMEREAIGELLICQQDVSLSESYLPHLKSDESAGLIRVCDAQHLPDESFVVQSPETKKQQTFTIQMQNYAPTRFARATECGFCGLRFGWFRNREKRFCYYTGKYYCPRCHLLEESIIPWKVINGWDWTMYPVSASSRDFLVVTGDQILYDIRRLNADLDLRSIDLQDCVSLRQELYLCWESVQACKYASILHTILGRRSYMAFNTHTYSITDLLDIANGVLERFLYEVVGFLKNHVLISCKSCKESAPICQICCKKEPLHGFRYMDVVRCMSCRRLYHRACMISNPDWSCPCQTV